MTEDQPEARPSSDRKRRAMQAVRRRFARVDAKTPPAQERIDPKRQDAPTPVLSTARPKIGVALGGGGARGIAHIGVLNVLEAESIPVDLLAGTSMGGIIAAPYALGYPAHQIAAEAMRLGSSLNKLLRFVDWQLTSKGLLQGQSILAYLGQQLGDETTFDQLKRPLALIAVDLNSGREVVLDSGVVKDAVRATMAIPGIIAPVELDGAKLVDGGILNNVPADVARNMGADVVIAVDVSVGRLIADPGSGFSAEQAISSAVLPSFALDMWRAQAIMMQDLVRYKLEFARPDVTISPPVPPDMGTFSFHRVAELIELGEAAARDALPRIIDVIQSAGSQADTGDLEP